MNDVPDAAERSIEDLPGFGTQAAKQPHINDILTALIDERGAIVSSADCSISEIALARNDGRFYVDADVFGFVLRTREWRANAEAALHDVADLHRKEKASAAEES